MPSRPSWEGFLKVNLISVPVKAYNASESGGGKIGFHLVHKECNSRIRCWNSTVAICATCR